MGGGRLLGGEPPGRVALRSDHQDHPGSRPREQDRRAGKPRQAKFAALALCSLGTHARPPRSGRSSEPPRLNQSGALRNPGIFRAPAAISAEPPSPRNATPCAQFAPRVTDCDTRLFRPNPRFDARFDPKTCANLHISITARWSENRCSARISRPALPSEAPAPSSSSDHHLTLRAYSPTIVLIRAQPSTV